MFCGMKLYTSAFNSGYNVKVNLKPKVVWSSKKKLIDSASYKEPLRNGVKPVFFLQ